MPVFTDALIGDTMHLTAEEFGCYCMLLFVTWRNNGEALTDDDARLARICRVSARRWREVIRPAIVGFYDLHDGRWHQKRLEKEWRFCAERSAISRSNGAKGGRPNTLKKNKTEIPPGSMQVSQEQSPHTHTHNKKVPSTDVDGADEPRQRREMGTDPVAEMWARALVILGPKRRSLLGKVIKQHGQVAVLEAIVSTEIEMPANPTSFFLGCLARAGPVNGQKLSPVSKLWQGAYDAAEAYNRRHGIADDRGADHPVARPLLDG